jgi:hypothetical protein
MPIKSSLGLALTLSVLPGCFTLAEGACRCSDPPGYCIDGQDAKELCAQFSYCHYDEGDSCLIDDIASGGPR